MRNTIKRKSEKKKRAFNFKKTKCVLFCSEDFQLTPAESDFTRQQLEFIKTKTSTKKTVYVNCNKFTTSRFEKWNRHDEKKNVFQASNCFVHLDFLVFFSKTQFKINGKDQLNLAKQTTSRIQEQKRILNLLLDSRINNNSLIRYQSILSRIVYTK